MRTAAKGPTEKDTCRDVVVPALHAAGWSDDQIRPEYPVAAQRHVTLGGVRRDLGDGRVDYVLEIVPGLPVAVVEAKRAYRSAQDGHGQAVRYGQQLDTPVAYATNGSEVIEIDLARGTRRRRAAFRSPAELWADYCEQHGLDPTGAQAVRQPFNREKKTARGDVALPRWYQQTAVNRVLAAMARGERRLLLLMATGTGKTFTAMQIVHKLRGYNAVVNPHGNYRVLYLADREALVTQPMRKDFGVAFGAEPMARVSARTDGKARDIVFATYQSLSGERDDSPTLLSYAPGFFDLVIVDECHRGSADENSRWREVLDHFAPAVQLGLTATPKQDETVDTYRYFGDPVFTYSLRDGIQDGYLAPYRVRRAVLDVDADGWEPEPGQVDDDGALIEDGVYTTRDFERRLVLPDRTRAVATYLVQLLRRRRGRMIVFCYDTDHAYRMVDAMANLAPDWTRADPEWVVRITGKDEEKTRLIEDLSDPDRDSPLVAVTSRLLATGVDVEDLQYVVIVRPVGSQVEFKQIVGRGTRLYPEKGKTDFEVIDFVGASEHFSDPDFDGFPTVVHPVLVGPDGTEAPTDGDVDGGLDGDVDGAPDGHPWVSEPEPPFTVDGPPGAGAPGDGWDGGGSGPGDESGTGGGHRPHRHVVSVAGVSMIADSLYVTDTSTGRLVLTEYGDFVAGRVRALAGSPTALAERWSRRADRDQIIASLRAEGVEPSTLPGADAADVDLLDVLAKLAWDQPVRTRAERVRRVRERHFEDVAESSQMARRVLDALLARYEASGIDDAISREALELPPLADLGSRREVASALGEGGWPGTVERLQRWIYSTDTAS